MALTKTDRPQSDEVNLRRALRVAKHWLDQLADPYSPIWQGGRSPYEIAAQALEDVRAEESGYPDPIE